MKKPFLNLWIMGIFGVMVSFSWGEAAGEIDPRLQKVLADWQKRQQRVNTAEYQVRGEHIVPQGTYNALSSIVTGKPSNQPTPLQDLVGKVDYTILLDFVKGRHHRKIEDQAYQVSSGKLFRQVMEDIFDGSLMKCHIPRGENPHLGNRIPEMTIYSGDMKNGAFINSYYPIFFGHGRIHTVMEQIIPGQLRNKPDPDYLYIHGVGVHDGRNCLVLRTRVLKAADTSFEEYWVDVPRGSAIVHYVIYSSSKPIFDATIHYRKTAADWMPTNWRLNTYMNGSLLYFENIRIEKVQFDIPVNDTDFEIKVKPGMLVEEGFDKTPKHPLGTPESTFSVYRLKKDGSREYVPDPYRRKKGDQYQKNIQRKKLSTWAWFSLPVVLIAGFFFWIWHGKRHK